MRFERSNLSKLRSRRASVERRLNKVQWQMANDPSANLAYLSSKLDSLRLQAADLTLLCAAEANTDERRTLRRALLASN